MFDLGPQLPVRQTAPAARTVGEMFWLRAARSATRPALAHKPGARWEILDWAAVYDRAARVAKGLLDLGLKPGERVAILGPTQPAWAIYDLGAQLATMVSFGIYPKQTPEQIRYLLEHSEAKVVLVDEPKELAAVLQAAQGLSSLVAIVPFSEELLAAHAGRDPRLTSPKRLAGERLAERTVRELADACDPDSTAILVYTSGTTGPPKGAMLSHRNILALLTAAGDATPAYESDASLNFLPMAHAAERILGFYGRVSGGVPGAYAQNMGTVLDDLQVVKPTIFGSVPRIFEKAHAKIYSELEKQKPAVRRLFAWAERVAEQRIELVLAGKRVPPALAMQHALADRLVFKRIRQVFGGRIRVMVTGAAPTAPEILKFFWAAGLPIFEAYGMTESTVITHINRIGAVRLGSVGRVIPPSECRIASDGEILVRGPTVFRGYFKNQAATDEIVQDGWLHTGDIGEIDAEGFLRITDRKKHLIITAGGKNLSPANIEKAIKGADPLISQVHAHGDRRNYVACIVAPSPIETLEWGQERGLVEASEVKERQRELMDNPTGRSAALETAMAKVVAHPELRERLRAAVRKGNTHLAQVEQVRRFVVLERDFSQEHGELTPTMKIKRKEVEQKYAPLLDRLYAEDGFGLEP